MRGGAGLKTEKEREGKKDDRKTGGLSEREKQKRGEGGGGVKTKKSIPLAGQELD